MVLEPIGDIGQELYFIFFKFENYKQINRYAIFDEKYFIWTV